MTQFWRLNGAERLGVELAEHLNRGGVQADVLSMYGAGQPGAAAARETLLRRGIPAVDFLGLDVNPPRRTLWPATRRLRDLLRERRYDIVETSQVSPTVLAAWATLGARTRHIAGIHDVFTRERHNLVTHRAWRYSVRANRRVRFYAISDFVRRHWLDFSGTQPFRTRMVLNAIPDDCFEATADPAGVRTELGLPQDASIALFVGRMLKRKGIDTLLEAVGPLLDEMNLYLVYVGDVDEAPEGFYEDETGLVQRMTVQIDERGWTERVRFLGRRADVPRLMAASTMLVHPARIEGFGLVLAEAMAAGLPVVASDVDGIPEVLAGSTAVMVPPDSPRALRDAVRRMLRWTWQERANAIAKNRAVAERYRVRHRVDGMTQLFHDALAARDHGRSSTII